MGTNALKRKTSSKADHKSQQDLDRNQHISDARSFQNIPAILPYEAKLALLKEIRHRDNRNLLKSLKVFNNASANSKPLKYSNKYEKERKSEGTTGSAKEKDNVKEVPSSNKPTSLDSDAKTIRKKESSHQGKQNKGNFLYNIRYGNLPVMEFKLPDGSTGTVDKVPRR